MLRARASPIDYIVSSLPWIMIIWCVTQLFLLTVLIHVKTNKNLYHAGDIALLLSFLVCIATLHLC